MVVQGRDALLSQPGSQVGSLVAAARVDDGRARHRPQYVQQLRVLVVRVAHHVAQVGALEAHAEHLSVGKAQAQADVVNHCRRGRSRQCQHRHTGQQWAQVGNAQVVRTEVVAPLRDAVGLVDGEQTHLHAPHLVHE